MRAAFVAAAIVVVSCSNPASHIYAGRRYEPVRDCIDTTASIDVVSSADPGSTCDAVCLAAPPTSTGERALYVSKMCPPYPPLFDTRGGVPDCERALAAYSRNDTCLADGGTSGRKDAARD